MISELVADDDFRLIKLDVRRRGGQPVIQGRNVTMRVMPSESGVGSGRPGSCRRSEATDPNGHRWPRYKASDDATAVHVRF